MRVLNDVVISQAVAASITSEALDTRHVGLFSAHYRVQGSAGITTGVIKLQGSNDPAGVAWVDIPSATANLTGNGSGVIEVKDLTFPKTRVVYSQASGDGTLEAWVFGKGF